MTSNRKKTMNSSEFQKPVKHCMNLIVALCLLTTAVLLPGGCASNTDPRVDTGPEAPGQDRDTDKSYYSNDSMANYIPPAYEDKNLKKSTVMGNEQHVTSSLTADSYDPIQVQQGIPVKWTLKVPEGSLNARNNAIVISEYNIKVSLKEGDNLIEFTPGKAGTFSFTSWEYEIRSTVFVADENGNIPAKQDEKTDEDMSVDCKQDSP